MPDRTQMLSVELSRETIELALSDWPQTTEAQAQVVAALRTALSQLEHQGDVGIADVAQPEIVPGSTQPEDYYDALSAAEARIDELEAAAPVLSDEERERLEGIIGRYEKCATTFGLRVAKTSAAEDIAFLRNLASQEQGE